MTFVNNQPPPAPYFDRVLISMHEVHLWPDTTFKFDEK